MATESWGLLLTQVRRVLFIINIHAFVLFPAFAQNQHALDSLQVALDRSAEDTNRVHILLAMARQYEHKEVLKEAKLLQRAHVLASRIGFAYGQGVACQQLGINLGYRGINDSALTYLERAREIYREKAPKNRRTDEKTVASISAIGTLQFYIGNYDEAFTAYRTSMVEARAKGFESLYSIALSNIGIIHYEMGQMDSALYYFKRATAVREEGGDPNEIAESYNTLAGIYQVAGDYENSKTYSRKALGLYRSIDHEWGLGQTYGIISGVFMKTEEYDSCVYYAEQMRASAARQQNPDLMHGAYLAIANAWLKLEDYQAAYDPSKRALAVAMQQKRNDQVFESHLLLTRTYLGNSIEDSALYHLEQGLAMIDRFPGSNLIGQYYFLAAKIYGRAGEHDKSEFYLDRFNYLTDSLIDASKAGALAEMQIRYETGRKDMEIRQLGVEKQLVESGARQRNILLWSSFAGLIVLVVFLIIIFFNNRQKQHTNELLENKNRENEALLKEIHHRVKNNLQIISSLLNLQSAGLEKGVALDAIKQGQNRVKSIALIHEKLYQTEDLREVDFQAYIEQLVSFLAAALKVPDKGIQTTIDARGIHLDIDTAVPLGLIINELVTNAYKYAFPRQDRAEVDIQLARTGIGEYELIVRDNGCGLPAGLDLSNSGSLGMKLVHMLARQLRGTVRWENRNGAVFIIRFMEAAMRNK